MMRLITGLVVIFSAVLIAVGPSAIAHKGASGVVKERMEAMKSMGKAMKGLNAMLRGKTAFDAQAADTAIASLRTHAMEIPKLFPKGSGHPPSEALPAIWEDWEGFSKAAEALDKELAVLGQKIAAGDRDAAFNQFVRAGKFCSGCHRTFRQKKKQ